MDERSAVEPLLGKPEQVLYGRLVRGFPGHLVLAHVALSRLLAVDAKDTARHGVADFVVCRADFTPLAVFGFADRLAAQPAGPGVGDRVNSRRDQLLRAAGIKVIHLSVDDIPREPALKALVAALPVDPPASRLMRRAS
jgi:hypothetical protein